jgi:hypothetical protein
MTPAARGTLRRWVLGGGRVLVVTAGGVEDAARAGLLPWPEDRALPNNDQELVEQMGLPPEDVIRDDHRSGRTFQLIYARYRKGLGGGVFFFRSANKELLPLFATQVLNDPALRRERSGPVDARVWAAPAEFIETGALPLARRTRLALFALAGGAALVALLAFARTFRTSWLAAGIPLAGVLLFTALLARFFRAPEVSVWRSSVIEVSADGRTSARREFALLENPARPDGLTVRGPGLLPAHFDARELASAGADWAAEDGELAARFRPGSPLPPALVFSAREVQEHGKSAPARESARIESALGRALPPGEWRAQLLSACDGKMPRGGILVDGGERRLLRNLDGAGAVALESCPETREVGRAVWPDLPDAVAEARGRLLAEALSGAGRGPCLLLFDAVRLPNLVRVEGLRVEDGGRFAVWRIELAGRVAGQ